MVATVWKAFEPVCQPKREREGRRRAWGADESRNKGRQSHIPWLSFRSISEEPFLDGYSLLEASSSLIATFNVGGSYLLLCNSPPFTKQLGIVH